MKNYSVKTAATLILGVICATFNVYARAAEVREHPIREHTENARAQWERTHPWRDQVNDRLEHQRRRIRKELREGEITPAQAQALHAQDLQIRTEERAMAQAQNGHITRAQQAQLNAQESTISQQIGH